MTTESGFVQIGNAHLYYELAGAGQPLVLVHAGVADSRQWNNEFPALARDYRVLRYDMRGYGQSLPVAGEYSHLADLLTLLDALGLDEPLLLLGCSMGGTLALDFALEYPGRVKALILVGSGPSGLDLDIPGHPQQEAAEAAYEAGDLDRLAELEAQIWFDGIGRTPQQVDPEMRALALDMNRLALTHEARQLGERLPNAAIPAAERLGELQVPLLALVGEHDLPYLHAAAGYMVENAPAARKVVLPDAAHLANLDHPDQFLAAVRSFLQEVA